MIFAVFVILYTIAKAWGTPPEVGHIEQAYILANPDPYRYEMHGLVRGQGGSLNPSTFWVTFCPDYEPQFSKGQTLKVLNYEDRGACWSVKNTHPAYLIMRDENGIPVLQ